MIFNSIIFVGFYAVFFVLYWFVFNKSLKFQNLLLLAGSYGFYGWWNWHFIPLLIGYSLFNYLLGFYINKAPQQLVKNILKNAATIIGIGLLFYFKYTNFFIESFIDLFKKFNIDLDIHTINIILPLGISFYTFRTLSYIYDIHKGKIQPVNDWIVFFSFVAFFPSLLSGPIDKAKTLLPQLSKKREVNYLMAVDGSRQILWGAFKKIVIADNLSPITNNAYDTYHSLPGSTLLVCAFYFSIQLYADFSGYSDMAIGIAKLLGFEITKNFDYPFFAQNIAEFWRKWHMSLTTWLTDYVFTPLSIQFRDYDKIGLIMAILINFTLIGIWHGANWTFVLFGVLHGCFYIPLILKGKLNKKKKPNLNQVWPTGIEFMNMLLTFALVSFSFILFRSDNLSQAAGIVKKICSKSIISFPILITWYMIPVISIFLLAEWFQRNAQYTLQIGFIKNNVIRIGLYYFVLLAIMVFGATGATQFIYLKF